MIDIHLFGITTPTGKYIERIFKKKSEEYNIIVYYTSLIFLFKFKDFNLKKFKKI